jgi:hypothetical protein
MYGVNKNGVYVVLCVLKLGIFFAGLVFKSVWAE